MKTKYVVGFLFSQNMEQVALITKNKPAFQAGLLNGIGGKVEEGESASQAMEREFTEETEYALSDWENFCRMAGTNNDGSEFEIDFFLSKGSPELCKSPETEPVAVYNSSDVAAANFSTIGNLPWLVALAKDFGNGIHPPLMVNVEY